MPIGEMTHDYSKIFNTASIIGKLIEPSRDTLARYISQVVLDDRQCHDKHRQQSAPQEEEQKYLLLPDLHVFHSAHFLPGFPS
jgi:hypothetical protein